VLLLVLLPREPGAKIKHAKCLQQQYPKTET
jgi:hypothetical protein